MLNVKTLEKKDCWFFFSNLQSYQCVGYLKKSKLKDNVLEKTKCKASYKLSYHFGNNAKKKLILPRYN